MTFRNRVIARRTLVRRGNLFTLISLNSLTSLITQLHSYTVTGGVTDVTRVTRVTDVTLRVKNSPYDKKWSKYLLK